MNKEQMEGDGEEKMKVEETEGEGEGDEEYDNFYEGEDEGEVDILSSLVSPNFSTAGSFSSSPAISFDYRDREPQSEWEEIPSRRWLSFRSTRSTFSRSRRNVPKYFADQSAPAPKLGSVKRKKFVLWQKIWWRRSKFDEGWVLKMMRATSNEEINLKRFHHSELMRATRNFSPQEKIGCGGSAKVYKGFLPELNMHVAIKKFRKEGSIKETINEAIIVSQLKHRNIVQLIGWCLRLNEFFLVCELMHNGSLDDHLFDSGKESLAWPVRLKIVLDLASALRYLHEEWGQFLVHRDINPSHVLLDSDFNAKLGDFGLSRLFHDGVDHITTAVVGTMGYLAPEYGRSGWYCKECDVYSFGVVALVIACGKRPFPLMTVEEDGERERRTDVVEWVRGLYGRNAILEAADERLKMEFDEEQMERLMMVGLSCTEDNYKSRPSMSQVIHVLTGEAPVSSMRLSPLYMISDISWPSSSSDGHNAHVHTDSWSAFQHGYNISTELKDQHVASPSRVIDYEASPFDKGVTVNLEMHETVIEEGMTFDTSASDTTEPEDVKTVEVLNLPATATTVPYVGVDKPRQLPAQPSIPINAEDGSDDILDGDEEINIDRTGTLIPIPDEHHVKIADGQKVSAQVVVVPDETPDVAAMPIQVQVTKDEAAESAIGEAMTRAPSSTCETDSTAVDKLSISTSTRCSTSSEPGKMNLRDRRKRMASLLVNEVLEMLKSFLPEEADEVSETISNVIKSLDSLGVDVTELVKLTEGIFKLTAEREARATDVFSASREEEIQKQLTDLKETLSGKAALANKIQESVDLLKSEETNLRIHAEELKAQVRQLEVQLERCRAQIQEASKRQEQEQATLNHILEEKEIIQQKIATLEAELTHLTPEGLLPSQVLQQMDDRLVEAKIALEFWQLRF